MSVLVAGCNSLTGVQDLTLYGADANGGSGGAPSNGGGASDTAGAAHPDGSGAGDPGTTTGETTTGDTTTGETPTGETTTGDTTTSTTTSPVDCQYPNGPTGVNVGNIVSGNLAWQGFPEGAAALGSVSIQDYFDCDGSKGINAILIDSSAVWCGVCQEEASDLPSQESTFQAKGVRVITLMIQDNSGNPATTNTAKSWRSNFGLDMYAVVADPNFSFGGDGNVGLPLQIIVDPRTMKIVAREEGFGGDYSSVLQLAQKNGG
ncbi:MAG: hypothetical protein U0441_08360 [Polyangiaceae bacterium]